MKILKHQHLHELPLEDGYDSRPAPLGVREGKAWELKLTHARGLHEAVQHLREGDFDLILVNLSLQDQPGFDTFLQVCAQGPESPLVLLTGLDNQRLSLKPLIAGGPPAQGLRPPASLTQLVSPPEPADEVRRQTQEHYQAMVEAFDGLIYISSADYEVEFLNRRYLDLLGGDPLNQKCYRALHHLGDVCPWCVNDRVIKGETVRQEVFSPRDNR
jgi:PAS domain-containing protein